VDLSFWLVLVAVVLIGIAGAIVYCGEKPRQPVHTIGLAELSTLWTKNASQPKVIHISQLSPLWREATTVEAPGSEGFSHLRIREFAGRIHNWPLFTNFPRQRALCLQLLALLDREGECSSVVQVHSDVESTWDKQTFTLLGQTSLRDHSLNVAEMAIELLVKNGAHHVIPDTLVAALAHDLGKLPSLRGFLYSLGEHPLASGRPLAAMSEFADLPKKEEILQAIKLHHKRPEGLLGKTLKMADQLARQKELEAAVAGVGDQPVATEAVALAPALPPAATIYGEDAPAADSSSPMPPRADISSWFDASAFLEGLRPSINKMFGRRFLAFSMPDGHIYFQVKVLEEVARRQAEKAGCMEVATMAPRDYAMRGILLAIVERLKGEGDIIDRGLIKDGFFGGYFLVSRKIGKRVKGYYTPFHAEPFGSIAEMESTKPEALRDIERVVPYDGREEDSG
jgi:hypothetical protein